MEKADRAPAYEKVILITGGAGFIGSHVAQRLVRAYPHYKIVNLDAMKYCATVNNFKAELALPNYRFIRGDITCADLVAYVMESEKVDTVMHFAAETHVDNSFGNSLVFTKTNVLGTHVLLEAAKRFGVRLFLHVSTDEVYGEGSEDAVGSDEGALLDPTNPYAASKAGAEHLVKAYHKSFALPVIITRGNNVYGPRQFPEKIIPKFITQLLHGAPVTIHGDGSNKRNYLHVEDVACAFDVILHKGVVGKVYNISGTTELSNLEVATDLIRKMDKDGEDSAHMRFVADRAFNDLRYPIDGSSLRDLGWRETIPWDDGLHSTIEWFKYHLCHWDTGRR